MLFRLSRQEDGGGGADSRRVALFAALIFVLAGCSSGPPTVQTETVDFEVGVKANDDNALAIDLVLVFDVGLIGQVSELTSATWFKTRDQIKLANPTGLEVQSLEVIPGQAAAHVEITGHRRDAFAAFVFAGYNSPGPHRTRIDGMSSVLIRLGGKDFAVVVPHS